MEITKLEPVAGRKVKVYLNGEYVFWLYETEIRRLGWKEEDEITTSTYEKVRDEIVIRRAKLRVMNLLQKMDKTEQELDIKLKQGMYPESIRQAAIAYVKGYHYVDDTRYAKDYIRLKQTSKSQKQIRMELRQKGIDSEIVDEMLSQEDCDDSQALSRMIEKKIHGKTNLSYEEQQKLAAFLFRKGFQMEDIRKALKLYEDI